jgi:hypothetical protein
MGANMSRAFESAEEAESWAVEQAKAAARWNLQKSADLGNTPVMLVPVVRPDGTRTELAVPAQPAATTEPRVRAALLRARQRGYHEDRTRPRQRGYVRSLRFD